MDRQQIDIRGARLDAVLSGAGDVTVVFENGLGTSLEEWDGVVGPIAARARTVRYESPSRTGRRTRADSVGSGSGGRSREFLIALALTPPYILVGHSWGGVIARAFAHRHPSEVAGLVLVDATNEALDSAGLKLLPAFYALLGIASRSGFVRSRLINLFCPPTAPPSYRALVERTIADRARWSVALRTAWGEGAGIRSSFAALRHDCPDLPSVPVRVLTARETTGAGAKSSARVHEAWQGMVARAHKAQLTKVPTSGHQMPFDAPEVVVAAIHQVLDEIMLTGIRLIREP